MRLELERDEFTDQALGSRMAEDRFGEKCGVSCVEEVFLFSGEAQAEPMKDATVMMAAIEGGDRTAAEQLLVVVYEELRRLAASKLAHEAPGQTLQPTALVHEAWLRLVGDQN